MDEGQLLQDFPAQRGRLVAHLSRLVGAADAEDLAAETLLKALAAVDGFRGEAALATWLHRIATNLAYDHLRRQGRAVVVPAEPESLPEPDDDQADPLEQRQMSACVQEVLATLPPAQRQLLLQADAFERSAAEIARDEAITPGNAKIRLHRARRALQAALDARCDFHYRDRGVLCCTPKPPA